MPRLYGQRSRSTGREFVHFCFNLSRRCASQKHGDPPKAQPMLKNANDSVKRGAERITTFRRSPIQASPQLSRKRLAIS
jgi:hypothetical protein